jgi:hypothetical protein
MSFLFHVLHNNNNNNNNNHINPVMEVVFNLKYKIYIYIFTLFGFVINYRRNSFKIP